MIKPKNQHGCATSDEVAFLCNKISLNVLDDMQEIVDNVVLDIGCKECAVLLVFDSLLVAMGSVANSTHDHNHPSPEIVDRMVLLRSTVHECIDHKQYGKRKA